MANSSREHSPGFVPDRLITRRGLLKTLGVCGATLAVDMASSNCLKSDIYETSVDGDGDLLTVIHPGIFSDVALMSEPLLPVTKDYGPTLMVGTKPVGSYSSDEHVERTVDAVERALQCYPNLRQIGGLGLSMGGGTVLDSLGEARRVGLFDKHEIENTNLTLVDSPTSLGDTSIAALAPATQYRAGIVTNGLQGILRFAGIKTVNENPNKEPFGDGADVELWLKTQKAGNKIPWSLVVDQARSLAMRRPPTPSDMAGINSGVFLGSTEDELVDHDKALPAWRAAAQGIPFESIDVVGAPLHCSVGNNPRPYMRALRQGYEFHQRHAA